MQNTTLHPSAEFLASVREQEAERRAQEADDARMMNEPVSFEIAMGYIKGWNMWYLKKNQPRNLLRIVRQVPKEFLDNNKAWKHYLQLFVKGKLEDQVNIDIDTYTFISNLEGWKREENGLSTYYVYRNTNAVHLPQYRYTVQYTSLALHLRRSAYSSTMNKTYYGPNEQCIPYRVRKKIDFKIISIDPA